jgi:flagellar hook-basal body protein
MYLVGYPADSSGTIISSAKSVLILDRTPLAQQATQNSTINLNLDNRVDQITGNAFNTTEPTSYSQSTSQTVYDDKGMAHTLSVYYKKMHSAELELTGDGTGTTFTFSPKQELGTTLAGEQTNLIASSSKPQASAEGTIQTISNAVLTYVSGGSEKLDTVIGTLGGITAGSGYTDGFYEDTPLSGGSGTGATADFTVLDGIVTEVTLVNRGVGYAVSDLLGVTPNLVGGTGTGFSIPVSDIQTNRIGTLDTTVPTAAGGAVNGTYTGVAFTGGTGDGAIGTVVIAGGVITSVTKTTNGTSYTAGDILTIPSTGGIVGATFNYTTQSIVASGTHTPTNGTYTGISLSNASGTGTGATATVIVSGGAITSVSLTDPGSGYLSGDVLTIGNVGNISGATIEVGTLRAGVKTLGTVVGGSGYADGIYEDVPLSSESDTGTGARATIVVSAGVIVKATLTESGSGYLEGETLLVDADSIGGTGAGFEVPISEVHTVVAGGEGTRGATYNLRLKDGTNLSVTQVSEASGTPMYTVNVDRYAVFATLDGNAVGQDASSTGLSTVKIGGILTNEQTSLGTVAFVGGKNIDSLSRDAFGTPQFDTQFKIDASGGTGSGWGQTTNGGVVQFTLKSTDMTAYSSAGQTYANSQDGSATSQLASYNVDSSGRLTAQYDNGSSVIKGQLILAYFNNLEGLIPNGNNTYEASQSSGEPLLSFPGDGTLGAIRSKAVEQSNVDLTEELVKLMVLQRQYSAVSQATKVMATNLIDEAINIGR